MRITGKHAGIPKIRRVEKVMMTDADRFTSPNGKYRVRS
jgi:hypothetical protein